MKLEKILKNIDADFNEHALITQINGLEYDSRQVKSGNAFFAVRGVKTDGHRFLSQATEKGAAALIVETPDETISCPQVRVLDTRIALARAAAEFYGHPSREMKLVGVTGTNGKTTTTYILDSIFKAAGHCSGIIGTVAYQIGDEAVPAALTTPESLDLQRILRHMRDKDATHVVMEVSSQGLDMGRVEETDFNAAIFTNLTHEHLDFHQTMEDYFDAKLRLFIETLPASSQDDAPAVVNIDDPWGRRVCKEVKHSVLTYSINGEADVMVVDFKIDSSGIEADLKGPWGRMSVSSRLCGRFNLSNILAAVTAATAINISPVDIEKGIGRLVNVPGRLELVGETLGGPNIYVDYAHSPDAVENLLRAVEEITTGKIITVVGAGGDRDRSKRPEMSGTAAKHSKIVVITSDNPRTEPPMQIIADVEAGVEEYQRISEQEAIDGADGYLVEPDRRLAIAMAVNIAGDDDAVVIAGKGHEDYQIIGTEKYPFDDRVEALNALKRKVDV